MFKLFECAEMAAQDEFFHSFSGAGHHHGPRPPKTVPLPPKERNLHYDISNIVTGKQLVLIKSTGRMSFHSIGDTGTDSKSWHNGKAYDRQDVADMMVEQCKSGVGKPDTPCFCYHLGDVIYPGSEEYYYCLLYTSPSPRDRG